MLSPARLALVTATLVAFAALAQLVPSCSSTSTPSSVESRSSADAFTNVARVLRHPRCLNCHPSGDRPHVGDDARPHAMNVQRGEDGNGRVGARCTTCHRDENQPLAIVPGAPHWRLAPRSMGWEGLDDNALADALKDRSKNGDRSPEELREHVAHDPLVLWGWDPGPGREAVPLPHAAFLESFDAWLEGGAPSPRPGTTSTF